MTPPVSLRAARPSAAAAAAAKRRPLSRTRPAAAAAAAAAEADFLLGPLNEETGGDSWPARRFPFGCCPRASLDQPQGDPPKGPPLSSKAAHASRKSSSSSSSIRVGSEGLYVLQLCSVSSAALGCLTQQLQQQQQEQQEQQLVFSAAAASAVYVHPVSLKVHLLRPERPLPSLDVLVVGAPFREGPRGASEQQQLAAAIQGAPHLEALVIRGDGRWLQRLAAACSKSKSLTQLVIEDIYSLEGPSSGGPSSTSSNSRGALRSSRANSSSSGSSSSSSGSVEAVVALYVKTVAAMPRGSSISLRGCGLGFEGFEVLLQQLQKHAALLRRLRELDVCDNNIPEEGGPVLLGLLAKGCFPCLQQLRLGNNSWGPRALEGHLKGLAAPLKELGLQGALGLGPPPIQGGGPPELGTLWLGASDVSVRVLKRLLLQQTARGALLHLDLSGCPHSLTDGDVAALLEALYGSNTSSSSSSSKAPSGSKRSKRSSAALGGPPGAPKTPLVSLNLARNALGAPVLQAIGGALGAPSCNLRSLDLSGNPCGVQTAEDEGAPLPLQPLIEALQGADGRGPCSLECLFLRGCSIAAADQLELAAALLLNQKRLRVLDVRDNPAAAAAAAGSAAAAASREKAADVAASLAVAAAEAELQLLLTGDSAAAADTAAAAGGAAGRAAASKPAAGGQQQLARRASVAAAAAVRRHQQHGAARRGRSRSCSSSKEESEEEETPGTSPAGSVSSRPTRSGRGAHRGRRPRLGASRKAAAAAAAAAAAESQPSSPLVPSRTQKLRGTSGVRGGPQGPPKGASEEKGPRSPAQDMSLDSGETSLLSDITDSNDSVSSSSSSSRRRSSSFAEGAPSSSRGASEEEGTDSEGAEEGDSITARKTATAAAAAGDESESPGDTESDSSGDSDYEGPPSRSSSPSSSPEGASSSEEGETGRGGPPKERLRPTRASRRGALKRRDEETEGPPFDSKPSGHEKRRFDAPEGPSKRVKRHGSAKGVPSSAAEGMMKHGRGAPEGGPLEGAPPAANAAARPEEAESPAAQELPRLKLDSPTEPQPEGLAQGAPVGALSQGGLHAPVSVVAEVGRIGGGKDRRGPPRGGALASPAASLGPPRAVRASGPPLAPTAAVGGAPFLIYFGVKGEGPSAAGAAFSGGLSPLPADTETQQKIKSCLEDLGSCLLRSFVSKETHRFVGMSPLSLLLGGPPQCILMGLKLLHASRLSEVSMAEVSLLQQLQQSSSTTPLLRLLLSVLLEELPRCSATFKYACMGALDPDDLLCLPGVVLYDGGPRCPAVSAAEFRVLWERRHSGSSSSSKAAAAAKGREEGEALKAEGFPVSVLDLLPPTRRHSRRPLMRDRAPLSQPATTAAATTTAAAAVATAPGQDPYNSPQRAPGRGPSEQQRPGKAGGGPFFATPAPLNKMKRPPLAFGGPLGKARCPGAEAQASAGPMEGKGAPAAAGVGASSQRGGGGPHFFRGPPGDIYADGSEGTLSPCAISPQDAHGGGPLGGGGPSGFSSDSSCAAAFSQQQQQQLVYAWEDEDWMRVVESCLGEAELQQGLCSSRGPQGGPCCCREVLVVDVQTDGALRRRVSEAQQLVGYCPVGGPRGGPPASRQRRRVEVLKRLVLKSIRAPSNPAESLEVVRAAEAQCGFVSLGAVRWVQVLCDSVGIPCRLMRGPQGPAGTPEFVYNVVLVGSGQEAEVEHLVPIVWSEGPSCEGQDSVGALQGALKGPPPEGLQGAPAGGGPPQAPLRLNPPTLCGSPCSGVPCCAQCGPPKPCGSSKCIHLAQQQQQQQRQQQQQQALRKAAVERDLDCFLLQASGGGLCVGGGVVVDLDLDFYFTFIERIGKGNFGEVWKVSLKPQALHAASNPHHTRSSCSSTRSSSSNSSSSSSRGGEDLPEYALKLVPRREENVAEAEMMRTYSHPRVVPFLGVFNGFQLLEDRTKQALLNRHEEEGLLLSADFVFGVLLDTARAMQYLHSPKNTKPHLLHRDLKPANILMKDGRALVTDFGVARVAEHRYFEHEMTQGPGTEGYIAPEQRTAAYDRPADVWAFGVVAARLLGMQQWKRLSDPKHKVSLQDFSLKHLQPRAYTSSHSFAFSFLLALSTEFVFDKPRIVMFGDGPAHASDLRANSQRANSVGKACSALFEAFCLWAQLLLSWARLLPALRLVLSPRSRIVDELFRLELERVLRSPYRDRIPLEEPDMCCCRFHQEQQQQKQQQQQQQQQQQRDGDGAGLDGLLASSPLLPVAGWRYSGDAREGAPEAGGSLLGGPDAAGVGAPLTRLAISLSACSSPRNTEATDPRGDLGIAEEGVLREATLLEARGEVLCPLSASAAAATDLDAAAAATAGPSKAHRAAAAAGFPLTSVSEGPPGGGPQRSAGGPQVLRRAMSSCSMDPSAAASSAVARRSSPRRSFAASLLPASRTAAVGPPQEAPAAAAAGNSSSSAAAAKAHRVVSPLRSNNTAARPLNSRPSNSSSGSSSSAADTCSSSSDSDTGSSSNPRVQGQGPPTRGRSASLTSPVKGLDKGGGGVSHHGGSRYRAAQSPAAAASRLAARGGSFL
ncbi:hypothetical protein Esti_002038 [Eimeria stiedai]